VCLDRSSHRPVFIAFSAADGDFISNSFFTCRLASFLGGSSGGNVPRESFVGFGFVFVFGLCKANLISTPVWFLPAHEQSARPVFKLGFFIAAGFDTGCRPADRVPVDFFILVSAFASLLFFFACPASPRLQSTPGSPRAHRSSVLLACHSSARANFSFCFSSPNPIVRVHVLDPTGSCQESAPWFRVAVSLSPLVLLD
jgi:hypothetical protein